MGAFKQETVSQQNIYWRKFLYQQKRQGNIRGGNYSSLKVYLCSRASNNPFQSILVLDYFPEYSTFEPYSEAGIRPMINIRSKNVQVASKKGIK